MKIKKYLFRFWRMVYPLGIYFAITFIVQMFFMVFYTIIAMLDANLDSVSRMEYIMEKAISTSLLTMLISGVLTFPILYFWMKKDCKNQQKLTGVITYEKTTAVQYILIVVLAIAACVGGNNLLTFSRIIEVFPGFQEVSAFIYSGGIAMELLVVGAVAPIVEEMLFRGLVYRRMREYSKANVAIVLSGLVFGIYHLNMVQGIYATFLGILLAYVYEKFHTIWAPIVFHMAANIMSVLMVEITFIRELTENMMLAIFITVVSIPVMIWILYKFRRIEQTYMVLSPEPVEAELLQEAT